MTVRSVIAEQANERFALPAEAVELAAGLRQTLARICPPEAIRAAWPGGDGETGRTLWKQLADLGLLALCVPAEAGGLGLDELFLVAAMDEVGYAGAPGPILESAAVVAPVLAAAGPELDELLARLLSGQIEATFGRKGQPTAYAQRADIALQTPAVLTAAEADTLTVVAGRDRVRALRTVDGSRMSGVIGAADVVASFDVDPAVFGAALDRGTLAAAAQLVGLARRMLEMTVAYVQQRQQFGHPIGSFQAVKHRLADAAVAVEFCRPMVLRAARSMAQGAGAAGRDVSAAKASASDLADTVSRAAIQCHGAMGYTTEYDLHLFAKRAWALAADWGDAAFHRARLASSLGL